MLTKNTAAPAKQLRHEITLRNKQKTRRLNLPEIRKQVKSLLARNFSEAPVTLGICFLGSREMAKLNWEFLQHEGSTDIITFDLSETSGEVLGEIYISIDDTVSQARQFKTTWQSELARYIIHGLLHLVGFDDKTPSKRKLMKKEENRLLRLWTKVHPIQKFARA